MHMHRKLKASQVFLSIPYLWSIFFESATITISYFNTSMQNIVGMFQPLLKDEMTCLIKYHLLAGIIHKHLYNTSVQYFLGNQVHKHSPPPIHRLVLAGSGSSLTNTCGVAETRCLFNGADYMCKGRRFL